MREPVLNVISYTASILDEAPTEIDRPKPIPTGTYLCRVQGTPTYDKSSKKGTPFVQFTLKPISAEPPQA